MCTLRILARKKKSNHTNPSKYQIKTGPKYDRSFNTWPKTAQRPPPRVKYIRTVQHTFAWLLPAFARAARRHRNSRPNSQDEKSQGTKDDSNPSAGRPSRSSHQGAQRRTRRFVSFTLYCRARGLLWGLAYLENSRRGILTARPDDFPLRAGASRECI